MSARRTCADSAQRTFRLLKLRSLFKVCTSFPTTEVPKRGLAQLSRRYRFLHVHQSFVGQRKCHQLTGRATSVTYCHSIPVRYLTPYPTLENTWDIEPGGSYTVHCGPYAYPTHIPASRDIIHTAPVRGYRARPVTIVLFYRECVSHQNENQKQNSLHTDTPANARSPQSFSPYTLFLSPSRHRPHSPKSHSLTAVPARLRPQARRERVQRHCLLSCMPTLGILAHASFQPRGKRPAILSSPLASVAFACPAQPACHPRRVSAFSPCPPTLPYALESCPSLVRSPLQPLGMSLLITTHATSLPAHLLRFPHLLVRACRD